MPTSVRNAIMAILFLAAVSGWVATAILASTVILPARADNEALAGRVRNYVTTYIAVEADGARYERVEPYLIPDSQAAAALEAEKAAKPAPVTGLALDGPVKATVLWRQGNQALAEAVFAIKDEAGVSTKIGEHLLLVLHDGEWDIDSVWRLALDPGTPLLPVEATPIPSATPAS